MKLNEVMPKIAGRVFTYISCCFLVAGVCFFALTTAPAKAQGHELGNSPAPVEAKSAVVGHVQEAQPDNPPTSVETPSTLENSGEEAKSHHPPAQVKTAPVVDTVTRQYADSITYNHPLTVDLLPDGSYLVARVGFRDPGVEKINAAGKVVWSFKGVQPVSAKRLPNGNTLVADSGVPGPPYYPRVLEVSPEGNVVWEHRFPSLAQSPRYAEPLSNGHILVTLPFMVVELDRNKQVVWSYGSSKPLAPGAAGYLEYPVMATGLANGHVLLVDRGFNGGRVLEIARNKQVVWQFGIDQPQAPGQDQDARFLTAPSFACRTAQGHTLVADMGSLRLLELDPKGQILRNLNWSPVLAGYPVMNIWQALPMEDKLVLVLTLTSSNSRILELNTAVLPPA